MKAIEQLTLRASPAYRLVPLERLSAAERRLAELSGEAAPYGMLLPNEGAMAARPRVASTDIALLFLTLATPGPVPAFADARPGHGLEQAIATLVLEGILEMRDEHGAFVSGAGARDLLLPRSSLAAAGGRTASLSIEALRYAERLPGLTAEELALRLYTYGRAPVTPAWRRRLANAPAIRGFLGLDRPTVRDALREGWRATTDRDAEGPWIGWSARSPSGAPDTGSAERAPTFKLYVSPEPEALPAVMEAVATKLGRARGVVAFKVAGNAAAVGRPDKCVVYFSGRDELHAGATRLRGALEGCVAHGVPFTAGITDDGLLSWGIDPPHADAARTSWRVWLASRLAQTMLGARSDPGVAEPWRYVLDRIRLDGVDPETWLPERGIWRGALVAGAA